MKPLIGHSVRLLGNTDVIGTCISLSENKFVGAMAEIERADGKRVWFRADRLAVDAAATTARLPAVKPSTLAITAADAAERMNKTEQRYADEVLEPARIDGKIRAWRFESIRLRLGGDCWYWPDFLVEKSDGTMELHEVKGFMQDDARVKLQVCADTYRTFPLFLVRATSRTRGEWTITRIAPGMPRGGQI